MGWFDAAAHGKVDELERHLQRKQKIDAKDKKGWTAIQHAIENGHANTVEFLLKRGADPNYAGAAFFALHAQRPDLLAMLLEHGLDPNGGERGVGLYIEKAMQETALDAEELRGKAKTDIAARPAGQCLIMLVDAGAKMKNHKWPDGRSPIGYAVATGDLALLRYVVAQGAGVNEVIEKRDGFTPLMWAAWYLAPHSGAVIRLLVKLGAKLEQTNPKGRTALDIAAYGVGPREQVLSSDKWTAKVLRELGAKETAFAKWAKEKRARDAARQKAELRRGDPVEAGTLAERRGTVRTWAYDTWTAMAVRVGDDIDAFADALEKSKSIRKVHLDVTEAALAGKLAVPKSRYAVILKLWDHRWASIDESETDVWYQKFQKQFSRDARQAVITCGHQDTAGASFFWLHENGKLRIDFESTGAYEEDPSGTRLKSDAHKKDWWKKHADENETIQALLREEGAYVPMFNAHEDTGKLRLEAFPEDALKAKRVERVMLVVYA